MRLYKTSLSKTVDSVNEDFFFNRKCSRADRDEIALWIAGRQGKLGSYANMFGPTKRDFEEGLQLFTGEVVRSGAALRHVSGEEACRALILLNSRSKIVNAALDEATSGMLTCLKRAVEQKRDMFCCGTCDPSLWRHIAAGGLPGAGRWLHSGMKVLKAHRDRQGRWRRFPFFYTLLALSEIDIPEAHREMQYAAMACEKYVTRAKKSSNPTVARRKAVVERVLTRC